MSRKKLSSLLFSLVVLVIVSFFSTQNSDFLSSTLPIKLPKIVTPTVISKNTVLGENRQTVKVVRVVDGDTIEIEGGQKVRYIGIDTPETHDPKRPVGCFGKEAAAKNKELVEGKEITMEKDVSQTDRYGRLLRFVYVDNIFVNDYLVRQGYAHASTYPPDVKLAQQFKQAEQEARENNRGLWNSCRISDK